MGRIKFKFKYFWMILLTVLMFSYGEASDMGSLSRHVKGREAPKPNAQRISPRSRPLPSRLRCVLLIPPSCQGSCIGKIICMSPNDMTVLSSSSSASPQESASAGVAPAKLFTSPGVGRDAKTYQHKPDPNS